MVVLMAQRGGQAVVAPTADALSFFKSYFVTGDYAVAGIGLKGQGGGSGIATGTIQMSGVPAGADVLAAFLYWQVVGATSLDALDATDGATFRGNPLRSAQGVSAKVLGPESGTASCEANVSGTPRTFTYRQDVLRFLALGADGRFIVNGPHEVQLPDAGPAGSEVPIALGASLVVVYRDPNPTTPLNAVVLYDGGYTMNQDQRSMALTIRGFYQAAVGQDGQVNDRITHIVGSGRASKTERLLFNGDVLAANPFRASSGASWDNISASPLSTNFGYDAASGQYVTTTVTPGETIDVDCLTWGAVVYRTEVVDTDDDGLLDAWEQSSGPLTDPDGGRLPDLAAMGADPDVKDVFIELGHMENGEAAYGGVSRPAHSHLPSVQALNAVGEAFEAQGIRMHFDGGDRYQSTPSPYVIPAGPLARGGEAVNESTTVCAPRPGDPAWVCQFSAYPGTVGWKTGFRFLRDAWVSENGAPLADPAASDACDASGAFRQRFDRNRQSIFHYVFSAHALGLPKSRDASDPLFHVPRTNTGIADLKGGDLLLTLGAFDDEQGKPVGGWFMQASTLMHELGHNFGRKHGGPPGQPNCKPNYLSVMSYLFQLRGLIDAAGEAHVDYSRQELGVLDESGLPVVVDVLSGDAPVYRTAWYAPQASGATGPLAARFCNGAPWDPSSSPAPTVRVSGATVGQVSWASPQDVNFDGVINDAGAANRPMLLGAHDWPNLRLNQVASRRNIGALYEVFTSPPCGVGGAPCLAVGPLSLDVGQGDLGQGDLGQGDLGQGDLGVGSQGEPIGELDLEVANALNAPPVAANDAYTANGSGATPNIVMTVGAPGVLANDTDPDDTSLAATLVDGSGPSHGTVTLYPNGSFIYRADAGFTGQDSFEYTANDVSRSSHRATVRITVPGGYAFEGVLNIPPPPQKTFKPGSSIPLRWRYVVGPIPVNSAAVTHAVTVTSADGTNRVYTNADPGGSGFRYASKRWTFNLQTKEPNGQAFPPGLYTVTIAPSTAGHESSPTFQIRLVK